MESSDRENNLEIPETLDSPMSVVSPEPHRNVSERAYITPKLNSAYPYQHTSPSHSTRSSSNTASSSIPIILITDTSVRHTFFRYTIKELYKLQQAAPALVCNLASFHAVAFEGQRGNSLKKNAELSARKYLTIARRHPC